MHTSRFSNVPEPSSRARRTVARCTCPMLAAARGSSENSTTSTFPPFSIKPFGARQSFPRCVSIAPFSWLAGMTSAPSRTRSSARAIAGGTTDSSWMDSICPSFSAAPRMRHSATARRSALASVRKTLSPTSEGAGDSGDSEDSEDSEASFACANVAAESSARVPVLEFATGSRLVFVPPAPRHARRADSATVPAARPTASWPNPITRAIGEDGTATSLRFVFDILWFFCGYEPEMFSFAFASATVDAGAIRELSDTSALSRAVFAFLVSVIASETKDIASGRDSTKSRGADAAGGARRVSSAAFKTAAPGAARLATPPVSTISANEAISLDARGPRVAAALRATPSAPRASCASAEWRSDIARGGSRVARAEATRVAREDTTMTPSVVDVCRRWKFGKFVALALRVHNRVS